MNGSNDLRVVSFSFNNRLTGTSTQVTMPAGSTLDKFRADHNLGSARLRITNPTCDPTDLGSTIIENDAVISSSPAKADGAAA